MSTRIVSPRELEEIYSKYNADVDNTDIPNLVSLVQVELGKYKGVVEDFFTGKADEIRFIYKSIRDNQFPYNRIFSSDSNKARHLYLEYYEGLKEYLTKLIDVKPSDELDMNKVTLAIGRVAVRDQEFISSIYAEDKNPSEEMDINSAMKNIEVLIDVYDGTDSMIADLKSYVDQSSSSVSDEAISSGLKLFANSIRHFHKDMIKEILECYEKIHQSIQKRTPVSGEVKVERYQIF